MRSGPFVALLAALLFPVVAAAQSYGGVIDLGNATPANNEPFSVSSNPQYPAPYSQATISFISGSVNLSNATLTASVDGKVIYTGAAHTFSVLLGGAGVITKLSITASSAGKNYTRTLSIQPQDVALIVEPISSAPPLYPGKPSVPLAGTVRIVAVANLRDTKGKAVSPSTLSYAWAVDTVQMPNLSGIGKSSIMATSPLKYRNRQISVVVTNSSGNLVGGSSVPVSGVEPTVRVYESDSLLGIRYEHALSGSYTISGAESTLYAAPFSLPTTNGAPSVQWFLNGTSVQAGNSVTLRPTGSGQGSASLSLTASGDNSTTAAANLSLIFGAPPSANSFGL